MVRGVVAQRYGSWLEQGLVARGALMKVGGSAVGERWTPLHAVAFVCFIPPAPDYDTSQWTNEKQNLGLDFPNVGSR